MSPTGLVGTAERWCALTHHSHVPVFGHDTVAFSEDWFRIQKRTWYQSLLKRKKKWDFQWIDCFSKKISGWRKLYRTNHEWSSNMSLHFHAHPPWTCRKPSPLLKKNKQNWKCPHLSKINSSAFLNCNRRETFNIGHVYFKWNIIVFFYLVLWIKACTLFFKESSIWKNESEWFPYLKRWWPPERPCGPAAVLHWIKWSTKITITKQYYYFDQIF